MHFFRFVFSFLYVRNWHTGAKEFSVARVMIFFGGLFIIFILIALGLWLQLPAQYQAVTFLSLLPWV